MIDHVPDLNANSKCCLRPSLSSLFSLSSLPPLSTPNAPWSCPSTQVGAVVVGFDRYINYYKIQYATLCIRENPGCLFIATNRDAVTHLTDAQEWAGNGSMVGAIAGSTKREPITVGKPAEFMLDNIARTFGLERRQICMVGDRLDTDILFGKNGGLTTCLVLSGAVLLWWGGGYRVVVWSGVWVLIVVEGWTTDNTATACAYVGQRMAPSSAQPR